MTLRSSFARLALLAALTPLSTTACGFLFVSFDFDREVELAPGEVRGVVVRADRDNVPAPFASVVVEGGPVRRAGADGRFSIKGLAPGAFVLRAADDVDGDGFPERTAIASAILRAGAPVALIPGDDTPVVSSVLLGPVRADGTATVAGRLLVDENGARRTPAEAGLYGRIAFTREFDLPTADAEVFDLVSLANEVVVASDATGKFVAPGIGTGTFQAIAFLFEIDADGAIGALVGASAPVKLRAFAGETLDLFDAPLVIDRAIPPIDRALQIPLVPEPAVDVYAIFGPPGVELPPCESTPPESYAPPFERARRSPIVAGASDLLLTMPPGIFDVAVCTVDGFDGPRGVAFQVTVPSGEAGAPPLLLPPLLLVDGDPCGDPSAPDCDGDGVTGLPAFVEETRALWTACVASCVGAFGELGGLASCTVDDVTYDCDDDGDGQPDVTESPICVGLGRGTDLDGDGQCNGTDPFPHCTANDSSSCDADIADFAPRVPDEYGGSEPLPESLFDAFFGDNGQALLGDPQEGTEEAIASLVDSEGHLFVASRFEPLESAPPRTRVRRLLSDGLTHFEFGDAGLIEIAFAPDGDALSTTPVAIALSEAEGALFVLTRVDDPVNLTVSFGVTKVDATTGQPFSSFGALGSTIVNVGEFLASPSASQDAPAALALDPRGIVWVVGTTTSSFVFEDLFVCPLDAGLGGVSVDLDPQRQVPRCEPYGEGSITTVTAAHLDVESKLLVVGGERPEVTEPSSPRAWRFDLQTSTFTLLNDIYLPQGDGLSAVARAVHSSDDGLDLHIAGDIDGRLTLWHGGGVTGFTVVRTIDTPDTVPMSIARDGADIVIAGSRTVFGDQEFPYAHRFVVGDVDVPLIDFTPESGVEAPPFVVHRGAFTSVSTHGGRFAFAGRALVDDAQRAAAWWLNPLDAPSEPPLDAGVPDQDDGGTVLIPGDAGSDEDIPCTEHAECASLQCPPDQFARCDDDVDSCACALDPCEPRFTPFERPSFLITNPEDVAIIPSDTLCVVGDITIQDFAGPTAGDALSSLKFIQGNLVITQIENDLEVDLSSLEVLRGSIDVQNNWAPSSATGLRVLGLDSLRLVQNAVDVTFVNNGLLPTQDILDVFTGLDNEVADVLTLSGNGCTGVDPSCAQGAIDGVPTSESCQLDPASDTFTCQSGGQ